MGIEARHHLGKALVVLAVAALGLIAAACGDGGSAATATSVATTPTLGSTSIPGSTVARGAPRWETVTTLTGTGPAEPEGFSILADAIQWRARWKCDTGRLSITTDPPPRRPAPLIDGACPGKGEGYSIVSGAVKVKVEATGPWQVVIDQQIDTPLNESPFEGMATAPLIGKGIFYNVEKTAKGSARIFKRADGANVLRLDDFEVSTNVDLFIWVSEASAPKTSADAVAAPHVVLGNLKSTLGNQNYVLPPDLSPARMKSVVIWCEPVRVVYGAAALAP